MEKLQLKSKNPSSMIDVHTIIRQKRVTISRCPCPQHCTWETHSHLQVGPLSDGLTKRGPGARNVMGGHYLVY